MAAWWEAAGPQGPLWCSRLQGCRALRASSAADAPVCRSWEPLAALTKFVVRQTTMRRSSSAWYSCQHINDTVNPSAAEHNVVAVAECANPVLQYEPCKGMGAFASALLWWVAPDGSVVACLHCSEWQWPSAAISVAPGVEGGVSVSDQGGTHPVRRRAQFPLHLGRLLCRRLLPVIDGCCSH